MGSALLLSCFLLVAGDDKDATIGERICREGTPQVSEFVKILPGKKTALFRRQTGLIEISGGEPWKVRWELDQDSRCPYNAKCIWGGEAVVKLSFFRPDSPIAYDTILSYGSQNSQSSRETMWRVNGVEYNINIELHEVFPDPGKKVQRPADSGSQEPPSIVLTVSLLLKN